MDRTSARAAAPYSVSSRLRPVIVLLFLFFLIFDMGMVWDVGAVRTWVTAGLASRACVRDGVAMLRNVRFMISECDESGTLSQL